MTRPTFTRTEASAILRVLDAVATADARLLDDEKQFLFRFAEQHGLPLEDVRPTELDLAQIAYAVQPQEKRKEVVRLCLEMAHTDRSYPPRENVLIWHVARGLGVTEHDLADLTDDVRGPNMPEEEW